jgi:hypothetical protein
VNKYFHRFVASLVAALVLFVFTASAHAQDPEGGYVSRKEYEELKQEMLALKKELESVKKEKATASTQEPKQPAPPSAEPNEEAHKAVAEPSVPPQLPILGTTKFFITGDMEGTFEARNRSISTFSASFNPIFLWELSPKLLFEGHVEFELRDTGTDVNLQYAQLTYLLNDYITLGAGEFLTPSNIFIERFHALWIDKLPDRPLAVFDGILPETSVGVEVRGGFPIGPTRSNYAFYVSNGPRLITNDPKAAGMLDFNNFTDNNDDKAVGGRVGFLPLPGVEVGYGFETARPGDQGTTFAHVRSWLQSVDLNVTRDSDFLKGRIDLRAQYAWTHVGHAIYDPDGSLGFGPLSFSNKRDGGYAQIAYRPTKANVDFLRNFEAVFRWDHVNQAPHAPGAIDEERWTFGLDYWLTAITAVKAAYEWDNPRGKPNTNALVLQVATGF